MTRKTKALTLLLLEVALLGGAAGGAIYLYRRRDQTPAKLKECQDQRKEAQRAHALLLSRNFLLEAEVGLLRGNPGFAFERFMRAQIVAQPHAKGHEAAFDEVNGLLLAQDPKARDELLRLAERILPLDSPPAAPPGAEAKAPPPSDKVPAAPPAAPPAAAPAPWVPVEAPRAAVSPAQEEAYRALLDAKTALLIGGAEAQGAVAKLARAHVMLDEAGRSDLTSEVDAAIAAARRRDDARARAAMDAVLARLRP